MGYSVLEQKILIRFLAYRILSFSKDEVVEYNEIINRIKKQQTKQNNHEQ